MKHYKHPTTNEVYAYESMEHREEFGSRELVEMTQAEVDAHLALTLPNVEDLLIRAKSELRAMRAPMLDALSGIAGRASRAGNDALAAEADALAVLLLDITDDSALNAAEDYEAMQAAGKAAYKRIAATASAELYVVFKEITGA